MAERLAALMGAIIHEHYLLRRNQYRGNAGAVVRVEISDGISRAATVSGNL
jgi:hypothetical protein